MLELLALIILFVVLVGLLIALQHTRKARNETENGVTESESNAESTAVDSKTDGAIRRQRGGLARMRRVAAAAAGSGRTGGNDQDSELNRVMGRRDGPGGGDSSTDGRGVTGELDSDGEAGPGVVLRRKKKKEANREAKREAQEARKAALEAAREREEAAAEAREREEEIEAAQEAAAAEAARKDAEEKARKEQEEYDQWKNMISIEDTGDAAEEDKLDDPALLQRFCGYIREHKVVILEDLAAEFDLHTEDVVDRLTRLEENGTLSGFFDDRGKFIYVTHDEMIDVANLIKRRGRISIQDLAAESSKLLHLNAVPAT